MCRIIAVRVAVNFNNGVSVHFVRKFEYNISTFYARGNFPSNNKTIAKSFVIHW